MFPRTAVVTGGASGIGAAIVELLRGEGAEVQALDLVGGFDVSDPQAWETVSAVELACLNAGVTTGEQDVSRLADDAYRRILGANLDGVVFGVRRLAVVMKPGSAIVATASLAGLVPSPEDPIYTLTKHAVIGFVRSVAPQLEQRGIRINAVAPGFVETPLINSAPFADAGFPLLQPEAVAQAALVAARSNETGQVWVVQPGREPLQFRFPNVPGPRDASGASVGAPPL
ncbi:MAG: SDR family NAD(P)-dependent oxidoreductase [Actinomycetota bacterium]|nr:SDR family NAD(P)-dependent oxidoreductase [Actinomycetota bacterium]